MKPIRSYGSVALARWIAGLLISPCLHAEPLAYDGFDDLSGTSQLSGKGGGFGWKGVWQTVNNGSADLLATSLSAAGQAPPGYDLRSIGGSALLPNGRRVGRSLDTSAGGSFGLRGYLDGSGRIGADGKTLYVSFIQQPNGTSLYYEFEFHRGSLGDPGRIAGIGNDQPGDQVNLRAPNGTHTLMGAGSTQPNFYVVRIDFKAGNDDVYVYRNPTSLAEPGVPTLTRLGVADMSFDGIAFGAFVNGRTVVHDELRFGETWSDVTVPPDAAPSLAVQPKAMTVGYAGGRVELSAWFRGQPLPTYQWYHEDTPLEGETRASLILNPIQLSDAGGYRVVATNSLGSEDSGVLHLEVREPSAGLLLYEGFDYSPGVGVLAGRDGGLGWAAPWLNVNGGGGTIVVDGLLAGNNAPSGYDLESSGNLALLPNAQRDGRLVDTSPTGRFGLAGYVNGAGDIGADGKTLYLSFLQQPDGTTKFFEFELHRGNLGDPGRIGGLGNDTMQPTVSLRTGGTQNLIGPGSTGVNFYVIRIDYKEGNDDVRVYQNPVSASEPPVATLQVPEAADLSFDGISLAAFDNGRTVKHDEIRIGQTWEDVVFGASRRNLVWTGDGVQNRWDEVSVNWHDGVQFTPFVSGDPVTFDDGGSELPFIDVVGVIESAHLSFENQVKTYVLDGDGSIEVSGGLHQSGAGEVEISVPIQSGSSMVVAQGDLVLSDVVDVSGELLLQEGSGMVTLSGESTFRGRLDARSGQQILSGTCSFSGLVTTRSEVSVSGTVDFLGGGSTLWLGNLAGADSSLTIEPDAVVRVSGNYQDALVVGRDGGSGKIVQNGGTFTYQPANRDSAFVGASSSIPGTTASYEMHGGLLDMGQVRLGVALGAVTADLHQTGGTILVRQLDLGTVLPQGKGIYTMEGGSMIIGSGGMTSTSQQYEVSLGAGVLGASASWKSSLDLGLSGRGGDLTIDTQQYRIVLSGNLSGSGGILKKGEGVLTLSGENVYGGITVVEEGTLAGFGSGELSYVLLMEGAALSPGDDSTGVFACATASLASGSILRIEIQPNLPDWDRLSAAGSIDLGGATLELVELGSGPIAAGQEFVIVQAAGGVTGTFAGLAEGAGVQAGGNSFSVHYLPDSVVLIATSVANPYQAWAVSSGLDGTPGRDGGFDADPDGDGVPNGLEWVLGGQPLQRDRADLWSARREANGDLVIRFDREENSVGYLSLWVQWSSDLDGIWQEVPIGSSGTNLPNGVSVVIHAGSTPDEVTVTIPAALGHQGRLFGRVVAEEP